HLATSAAACAIGLPISSVIIRASETASDSMASAAAFIHVARCAKPAEGSSLAASAAWAIRRSISAASCGSNVRTVPPVAGLTVAIGIGIAPSVEDDDLAAHNVTASQGFQVLIDLVELDFGDVVFDATGFRKGEHFDEVQVVAPEGTEVGQLG